MLCGVLGKLQKIREAIESYEPERGVKFKTHSYSRIRGSILDDLRGKDLAKKDQRRKKITWNKIIEVDEAVTITFFFSNLIR